MKSKNLFPVQSESCRKYDGKNVPWEGRKVCKALVLLVGGFNFVCRGGKTGEIDTWGWGPSGWVRGLL